MASRPSELLMDHHLQTNFPMTQAQLKPQVPKFAVTKPIERGDGMVAIYRTVCAYNYIGLDIILITWLTCNLTSVCSIVESKMKFV